MIYFNAKTIILSNSIIRNMKSIIIFFFFSSRRRHTSFSRDWSSDECSSDQDDEEVVFVADYELVAVEDGLVANAGHGLGLCLESRFRILHVIVERTPGAKMKLQ